ncbi:MAG: integrase arm-type DNA-binding domain-containing protein [Gammaproteobacteria bacterium]|nr:integrase arm-type DNA-binding domain-containing protein [Gammaproteobacteria bacterium]
MARTKERLTATAVKNRKTKGRMNDGQGLILRITDSGSKGWIFRHTFPKGGKVREMGLGGYPAISLAEARVKADECRRLIAAGTDPKVERDKLAGMTFGDVADKFFAKEEMRWSNDKARYKWRRTLWETCEPIRSVPVVGISTTHVRKVLDPIWLETPHTATRVRSRIEEVLDFARASGFRDGDNPARWRGHLKVIMPSHSDFKVRHQPAMPYAEIPSFMEALKTRPALTARALEFLILTACRTGEALGATWDEIDFDNALWTIPESRMKQRDEHRVPLSERCLDILTELNQTRVSNYVFPGQRPNRPLSNMTLTMLLRRMKIKDATAHGFRSSFRDWAGDNTAFSREVAEAALAHKVGGVEGAYRRGTALKKRRQLMNAWADYCQGAAADNVVRLSV